MKETEESVCVLRERERVINELKQEEFVCKREKEREDCMCE